jgi:hypothetical protein
MSGTCWYMSPLCTGRVRRVTTYWWFKHRCSQPGPPAWEGNTGWNYCQYLIKQCERETGLRNEFLIGGHLLGLKVAEDDTLQQSDVRSNEEFPHFFDGIFSGVSTGIAVDSGANSGKSNTLHIVFDCQFQTAPVAGSKERDGVVFVLVDWADCVDHTLAGQFIGGSDLCIASVTSIKMVAFFN